MVKIQNYQKKPFLILQIPHQKSEIYKQNSIYQNHTKNYQATNMRFSRPSPVEITFSSDYFTEESKSSFQGIPLPLEPQENPFLTNEDAETEERRFTVAVEHATTGSEIEGKARMIMLQDSFNSVLNLSQIPKLRHGIKTQSNTQKIIKYFTKAHFNKNFPAEMFRWIKKFLKEVNLEHLLLGKLKRFNITQLTEFIQTSGLTEENWEEILELDTICKQIEKSKKLGTSMRFKQLSPNCRKFLVHLSKEAQKILYRSAKRVIARLLRGEKFIAYLDSQARAQLHQLDFAMEQSPIYSAEYKFLLSQLN